MSGELRDKAETIVNELASRRAQSIALTEFDIAAGALADEYLVYPAYGAEPIDEAWLLSQGFVQFKDELSLAWSKPYGEDTAEFCLSVMIHDGITDAIWELSCQSIELPMETCMMPCQPTTRSQLRDLLAALGVV
jgi:hypothetical protein